MKNRDLHDALRDFAVESAGLLRESLHSGAELEFDLEGGQGNGPTLYHYKPLTAKFIADRWPRLANLPSCAGAAQALDAGASAYLRVNGADGARPEPALQVMLERLWEDMTDFSFPEDRFERVYAEVERTLFEKSMPATVLVAVHGIAMQKEQVDLGDGLMLVRGDLTDAPDEAVWGEGERNEPAALLMLTREVTPEDLVPVEEARMRFRRMLTCLRLWKAGGIALAAVAWRRTGDGRWQPFELEATGAARGEPWILIDGEEAELGQFVEAIEGVSRGGSVAWALSRFEMGCGRRLESEALSDYLLALRALVDSNGDAGRSSLALRVAVLCAEESERKRVQRRVELAQALERFVMGDGPEDPYLDAVGSDSPRTLVDEVERHLRALLRDVMCGYLDADLRSVADGLLLSPAEPFEIKAEDLRPQTSEVRAQTAVASVEPVHAPEVEPEPEFFFDDDPASFSAPV
jgi:hypothetical protein